MSTTNALDPVEVALARAFAPMHKAAFGTAVGITAAIGIYALTAFHLIAQPPDALSIDLLGQYFFGYTVSWVGAAIGAWWALVAGFVGGWFLAFLRNFAVAIWLVSIRIKANLADTRDFLDHI
jgi:hypothetical protein